ncbi:hypothetical protein GCM10011351_31530 [Paraliobacillus quinghaiensis]|uniref:Uncharacterized protein n=1 Tax=Paraliobacillus quinghaiensis TaxID=470815 RepID=A0A917WZF0_9BACI|nr:hypothetical protein GCM10011351_31530 [Paraliobacillus quinghaiensis]
MFNSPNEIKATKVINIVQSNYVSLEINDKLIQSGTEQQYLLDDFIPKLSRYTIKDYEGELPNNQTFKVKILGDKMITLYDNDYLVVGEEKYKIQEGEINLEWFYNYLTNSQLSYTEVRKESLNKDIQSFFQGVKEENGIHLYLDNHNAAIFVYLNGSNVVQGEEAMYFTEFDVESDNETLNLLYKSDKTSDHSNSTWEYELFYKVNLDKDYEEMKLFNNGNETHLGTISGNN